MELISDVEWYFEHSLKKIISSNLYYLHMI